MNVDDVLNGALRVGAWPLAVFIIATIAILMLSKKVFPALGVGIAAGLLTFVLRTQGS